MSFTRRARLAAGAVRWQLLDWVDRSLFVPAVERVAVRRLAPPRRGDSPDPVTRIHIDISVIHMNDAGTGIQRVVRSLRNHLPAALRPGIEHEMMIVRDSRVGYVSVAGEPLAGAPGSLFFGLDFATDSIFAARQSLADFKRAGGRIWFLVHDILPLSHPHWFTPASRLKYRRWLRTCAALADGFLCVSPVVAAQLKDLLEQHYRRPDLPRIATIELGSDIALTSRAIEGELPAATGLDSATFTRAALVVGTLEPRKGHADVLAAFDLLWADGHDIPLVLIGKVGWGTSALQQQIRDHPQHGRLLFWLDDVDDHALHAAYRQCRMVVVPSLAEGYGLPLDEALAVGAPVLARDIAVFRRHDAAPVRYFAADADASAIADALLAVYAAAEGPRRLAALRTWDDTARQVARELGCAD